MFLYLTSDVRRRLGPEFKPLSETFDPTYKDDTSAVGAVVVEAPFGMIIEESGTHAGKIEVMEVVADGNAAKAGVQAGDILRGTTAMALNIEKSSEEDFGFSVGFSEGKRSRGFLNVDRKKFDLVMAALKSNAISNSGRESGVYLFFFLLPPRGGALPPRLTTRSHRRGQMRPISYVRPRRPGEATLVFERRVKQPEDEASESESE